ncbi:MAG: helix-turn-helix transcriptional regulator [bacterium]
MSDRQVLKMLGARLRRQRLNQNITQDELAKEAGISRTVVQKMERGEDCVVAGLIRVMRALNLLDQLDNFLPDPGISPIQIARMQGRERQRASGGRKMTDKGRF